MDGRKCYDCDYRDKEMRDNGWCYMFKEQPIFLKCAYKTIKGKRIVGQKVSRFDLLP